MCLMMLPSCVILALNHSCVSDTISSMRCTCTVMFACPCLISCRCIISVSDVGSWREGGGRAAAQQQVPEGERDATQNGSVMSGGGSGTSEQQQPPQPGMRPTGQGPPFPVGPGRPMMPPYRGMMPPQYVST